MSSETRAAFAAIAPAVFGIFTPSADSDSGPRRQVRADPGGGMAAAAGARCVECGGPVSAVRAIVSNDCVDCYRRARAAGTLGRAL